MIFVYLREQTSLWKTQCTIIQSSKIEQQILNEQCIYVARVVYLYFGAPDNSGVILSGVIWFTTMKCRETD